MGKKTVTGKATGFNIYKDEADRTIYYDVLTKQAYYVSSKEEKKLYVYNSRIATGIAVGYIAYYLSHSIIIGAAVGIGIYLALFILFRKKLLSEMVPVDRFEKGEKKSIIKRYAETFERGRIIAIILLAFLLAGLTVYNVSLQQYDKITNIMNYVLAAGAFIYGFIFVIVFFYQKKHPSENKQ